MRGSGSLAERPSAQMAMVPSYEQAGQSGCRVKPPPECPQILQERRYAVTGTPQPRLRQAPPRASYGLQHHACTSATTFPLATMFKPAACCLIVSET